MTVKRSGETGRPRLFYLRDRVCKAARLGQAKKEAGPAGTAATPKAEKLELAGAASWVSPSSKRPQGPEFPDLFFGALAETIHFSISA